MSQPSARIWSSVGKKLLNGGTGLLLVGFVIAHLAGNLTLLIGRDAFNGYAHSLEGLGGLVYVMELGLIGVFAVHAISAVSVWLDNRKSRATRNQLMTTKGAPSKQTVSSRTMIYTGLVLLVFVVLHVIHFKFGPGITDGYQTALGDQNVRDLHRLVVEQFKIPIVIFLYTAVMVLLGFHLRHGIWSALQSIGALNAMLRPVAFSAGLVFAIVMAVGFLILPLYIFLFVEIPTSTLVAVQP